MDIMTDDELLGFIGHEIDHVVTRDFKKEHRTALLTSALKDGVSSKGRGVAKLKDSQLSDLSEAIVNTAYPQKQDCEADYSGYEFLKKYGNNPSTMTFKKLKKMQEDAGVIINNKKNQPFSTNPHFKSRIKRIKEHAEKIAS